MTVSPRHSSSNPPLLMISSTPSHHGVGDVYEEKVWSHEEGLWAECAVWLWDRPHHLQPLQQAVPVRQHRHGQSLAQIHRVQRAPWEQNQCRHHWGKGLSFISVFLLLLTHWIIIFAVHVLVNKPQQYVGYLCQKSCLPETNSQLSLRK